MIMKFKYILPFLLSVVMNIVMTAAESKDIALGVYVSNSPATIPAEAASLLERRMERAVTANGFADNECTGRFALVAKCDVIEKDITPTTPARISQKLEISFIVVDLIENKIYGNCEMTVAGIGTNETKAFSSAFQKVSAQNTHIKTLLENSKDKIMDYYRNSCPQIITTAKTLASTGEFDKAIFSLISVPDICTDCFVQCQALASEIFKQKIDSESTRRLEQAKNKWAASPTSTTAGEIAVLISGIDPRATNYSEVRAFRADVSGKLAADAQREWEFKMKQYEDNQEFKMSIVAACRSIGETFAKNFKIPAINLNRKH